MKKKNKNYRREMLAAEKAGKAAKAAEKPGKAAGAAVKRYPWNNPANAGIMAADDGITIYQDENTIIQCSSDLAGLGCSSDFGNMRF